MDIKKIINLFGKAEGYIGLSAEYANEIADFLEKYESEKENLIHYNADLNNQLNKAEAHIEKLQKQLAEQQPEWISVEDRLPEENGTYLIAVKGSYVSHFTGFDIESNEFCDNVFRKADVTHWMSLPEPPKPKEPTFKDVFLEKFPGAVVDDNTGVPKSCWGYLYGDDKACPFNSCSECWNQPYFEAKEGEADA